MKANQESEASSVELQVNDKLKQTIEEIAHMSLEQIRALRSYLDQDNFATCQKSSYGLKIPLITSNGRYVLRLSLELSKVPSQTSDT